MNQTGKENTKNVNVKTFCGCMNLRPSIFRDQHQAMGPERPTIFYN